MASPSHNIKDHSASIGRRSKEGRVDEKQQSKASFGVKKRQFLNWDPVKFFNHDELDGNEIISNSRKIQEAFKMKDILDAQLESIPKTIGVS